MTPPLAEWLPRAAGCAVIVCLLCAVTSGPTSAQRVREADIKAAFLYNFTRFVEWPADAFTTGTAPFRIEIIGRDPFDGRLDQVMAGKKVQNHTITVSYTLSESALPSGHIVVISASEPKRVPRLLDACRGKPVLTVSDLAQFAESGGTVGFVSEDGRIRFAVNTATIKEARLRIDSRMLAVARPLVRIGPAARSN